MKITEMVRRILREKNSPGTVPGRYNPELDKYEDIDLFPKKTAKAREILAKAGLPPELQNRQAKK